jgi:hypothetical protein
MKENSQRPTVVSHGHLTDTNANCILLQRGAKYYTLLFVHYDLKWMYIAFDLKMLAPVSCYVSVVKVLVYSQFTREREREKQAVC